MGDKESKNFSVVTDDVIKFFDFELKYWNKTIENLKETLKTTEDRNWMPAYLYDEMEQTETRWTNIKSSLIMPKDGRKSLNEGTCNIKRHKDLEADMNQLRKNNERLVEKNQESETRIHEQQQKINEYENNRRKDDGVPKVAKEGDKSTRAPNDTQERHEASANVQRSEKGEAIAKLRNQTEFEEKSKKQKEEIDRNEAENDKLKQKVKELEEQNDKLKERNKQLEMDKTKDHNQGGYQRQEEIKTETGRLQKQIRDMQISFEREQLILLDEKHILMAQKETLETQANDLQKEKDVLLLRLSKIAGDRLVNNNAAIADLSDPNRPTKLGEFYSEIYDNEWTDAFDALKEAGYEDEEAIETLRMTLENVVQFCECKAAHVIHKSTDAVNLLFEDYRKSVIAKEMPSHLTMPRKRAREFGKQVQQNSSLEDIKLQQRWKPKQTLHDRGKDTPRSEKVTPKENPNIDVDHKLRQLRKEMATYMIPIVQKAYIEACWTNECIEAIKPFILKCIYLGWMMVVQSPPMVLHRYQDDQEIKFNKNFHREYTSSGPLVRYIVWPALLLNENGPVVCKGVAEGKKPMK